ncbi:MAG TPA: hypothetical protein VLC10_01385 [Patescibacteria group bacterium]|nr:hypothetical protein [Patescibacteria group bacterium]
MDFIYDTWWLWLLISLPLLVLKPRDRRPHALRESLMAVSGILFIASLILHFLPRI